MTRPASCQPRMPNNTEVTVKSHPAAPSAVGRTHSHVSMVAVMALDRFLESLARRFNGRQVALEDEIQLLQKIDIDWPRHRNDETVIVAKMTVTDREYKS